MLDFFDQGYLVSCPVGVTVIRWSVTRDVMGYQDQLSNSDDHLNIEYTLPRGSILLSDIHLQKW